MNYRGGGIGIVGVIVIVVVILFLVGVIRPNFQPDRGVRWSHFVFSNGLNDAVATVKL